MDEYRGQRFGNYRLISLLGKGGYARVYLGEHIYLRTQVAIKVLDAQLVGDKMEQFCSEASIIARLEHPHIVRIIDFGMEADTPYLVMDYAPNGTLRRRHPQGFPLPLPTVVSYAQQAAAALDYAHQQKVVHRDVKPENLLLGRTNTVLLSDFGIAVMAHQTRSMITQDESGTVAYMAPEQIRRNPHPASDQYALGAIVYEWLTGYSPFQGSPIEIAMQHLEVPPPPLCREGSAISPEVEKVVLKALEKDRHLRFDSILGFASSLEQASRARTRVLPPLILDPPHPVTGPTRLPQMDTIKPFTGGSPGERRSNKDDDSERQAPPLSVTPPGNKPTPPSGWLAGTHQRGWKMFWITVIVLLIILAIGLGSVLLPKGAPPDNTPASPTPNHAHLSQSMALPPSNVPFLFALSESISQTAKASRPAA